MADISEHESECGSPHVSISSAKKSGQVASRQSGRVTFPTSSRSAHSKQSFTTTELVPMENPFKMPPDSDIFLLRDKERQKKKQDRIKQRKLRVHEKTTYASRVNFRTAAMIHPSDSTDEGETDEEAEKSVALKEDAQFTIAVTRDRHVEKESLAEYIAKKREMFLVQYSLGVKRDEMRKLEEIAQAEERKLELAEQFLEEDAAMFDEFLKENDKNSVEAIKVAEAEAKQKMEKVNEIKKINASMMAIKSEISKYEDIVKEYQMYRQFLDALTPQEVLAEREKWRIERLEQRRKEQEKLESASKTTADGDRQTASLQAELKTKKKSRIRKQSPSQTAIHKQSRIAEKTDDRPITPQVPVCVTDTDSDDELDLYFKTPQQLLDIFAELEEQNLSLIQNSQETEESLEEMKQTMRQTRQKMTKETKVLKDQIDKLQKSIVKEEERGAELRIKAKMFNYGEFKEEDQQKSLETLNSKVEEVYRSCIGDNEANISTLQMLTNIENRLEELFEIIETMPPDKVEAAEKAKEKERRLKMREEKLEQQRLHQEERVRKALERAKAEPKKVTGKRLVFRSEPPQLKKKEDDGADQASREEEELAYFFQW